MIKPAALREGDTVALVAPSGPVVPEVADALARRIGSWGLTVRFGEHALGRHGYLSAPDEQRLSDLNEALRDPAIRGVLCLRGGYGLQRIADGVDMDAVRADPKVVMGFSDVTALHVPLWLRTGLATIHGPNSVQLALASEVVPSASPPAEAVPAEAVPAEAAPAEAVPFVDVAATTAAAARHALMSPTPIVVTVDPAQPTASVRVEGRAEGTLLGGNLTMLATNAGTRDTLNLDGAILLLEEVSESPYRVDRSLTQLVRAGWFDGVRGVAVGQFTRCGGTGPTTEEVLLDRLSRLGVPVLGGLPIGHDDTQIAVGLGVPAVLDTGSGTLTVQPAVTP